MTETITPTDAEVQGILLKTLLYFDVFSHPLTADEVCVFSKAVGCSPVAVREHLDKMALQGLVFEKEGFFMAQNKPEWVAKRLEKNKRADEFLPKARRMSRFIAGFPFVRGVCVSGSLSKHCMSADSDVDFFIITAPRRLWLARTLLVAFKKIFLLNSHKYFCVNYFVDTEHLEIEEKNLFTATETVTLLPMYGEEWYDRFYEANPWAYQFYPNFKKKKIDKSANEVSAPFKKTIEWLFSGRFGEVLDRFSMRLTLAFWRRKFRDRDPAVFDVALKSRKYVSKHHPLQFQEKVLRAYEERCSRG